MSTPQPVLLSKPTLSSHHRVLILGDSGTGKTRFLGTMPKPLIIDFDNGVMTLAGHPTASSIQLATDADGWVTFMEILKVWRKSGPQHGAETLCVDSISFASEAVMNYVLRKNNRGGAQPTIGDWGEAIREMKDALAILSVLPCNVAVTAHAEIVKDETLGDIQWIPLILGRDLPHRLPAFFNEVYLTTVTTEVKDGQRQSKYRLQVKPDSRTKHVKTRLDRNSTIFSMYEEPDFAVLLAKVNHK